MGERGPPKTPLHILEMRGSRLATDRKNEVAANKSKLKCPPKLGKHGKKKWKEIVADLEEREINSTTWGSALELLASLWERIALLSESLGDDPRRWKGMTDKGYEYIDPLVAERDKLEAQYLKMLKEFGLTPCSKSDVKGSKVPAKNSGVSARNRGEKAS